MHVTKKLALGLGTGLLSLALVGGIAAAAFTPADAQPHDEKDRPPVGKLEEILGKLVSEGKLSADQSATIIARLKEAAVKVEEKRRAPAVKPEPKRDEKKHEQRKEEQTAGVDVHKLLGKAHRLAGEHLGLTKKALGEQLRSGKSLAEIAATDTRPETTRESLIAAISVTAKAKLDELKAAGKLTEAQVSAATVQLGSAVAKIVDAKHARKGVTPDKPKQP